MRFSTFGIDALCFGALVKFLGVSDSGRVGGGGGGFDGGAGCGFVVPVELLGEDPVQLTCPHCHQIIVTEVVERVGCLAYALSALLCLLG